MSGTIDLLVALLDESFDHQSWHGTNLRGSLRGITAAQAAWRPGPRRHSIWEIAVHAAYWKYAARRRLTGEARGSFPLRGSNWFPQPDGAPDQRALRRDLAMLGEQHRLLREVVTRLTPAQLSRKPRGSRYTIAFTVRGTAAHDLYHAGQVQLLKRLQRV
jgi:hypothetical protein